MPKVTKPMLDMTVIRLNAAMGTPLQPYTREDGQTTTHVGNYHLDSAYGQYSLCQLTKSGGTRTVLPRSSNATLLDLLHAFMNGAQFFKESQQ